MKLRTQGQALLELRQADPNTCLTAYALRTMVLDGRIPTISLGRKKLLDIDALPAYLTASDPVRQTEVVRETKAN